MIRSKPIVLPDGTLLLPAYDERDWTSFALASDDGGATWAPRGRMSGPGLIQPSLALASVGTLAFFRRGPQDRTKRLWRSVSLDNGHTWSTPERTELPNPNAGIDVVSLTAERLALAFNDAPSERSPLSLAVSDDGGRTWTHRRALETGPHEYSYPAIIVDSQGRVHVTYTWRRERIKHVMLDEETLWESGLATLDPT
jgi:predicted neuraminidase